MQIVSEPTTPPSIASESLKTTL